MKTNQNLGRWLGLALACGLLTSASTTQAAKPPKPPPSPAYVPVFLGGLRSSDGLIQASVSDLNNLGQVVGGTSIPGYDSGTYSQAFLLNPRDTNGDGKPDTWFMDAVNNVTGIPGPDGQNDLIIGLGGFTGARQGSASAVNDLGLVVGSSYFYDPGTQVSRTDAFIVMPSGPGNWYQDVSPMDGVNDLMLPLGSLHGNGESCEPSDINNVGQIVGTSGGKGFLLTPVENAPGVWQWFQDLNGDGANDLMFDLGDFIPSSINDRGQIVGSSGGRAMLQNPGGSVIDLGAAGTVSEAVAITVAINNRGQIGLRVHLSSVLFQDWRARLLTPLDGDKDGTPDTWYQDLNSDGINDLIVDLGTVERLTSSAVAQHGLNDGGSVVGTSWWYRGGYHRAPFLWQNGVIQSLKNLTGGTLEFWDVSAINNAGQIVCVAALSGEPVQRACILLPTR